MNQRSGFSLPEVIIALGLLSVGALSLLGVFVGGMKLMQRSSEVAAANEIAKSALEGIKKEFRSSGSNAFPAGTYRFDGRIPDSQDATTPEPFPPAPYPTNKLNGQDYFLEISGDTESPRLKRISVTVHWDEDQSVTLATLIHR